MVVLFYIGLNSRFDEFVAPTLHFSCEPGQPDRISLGVPQQSGIEIGITVTGWDCASQTLD